MLERSQRFKKERTELFLNHATQNCMKRAEIFYFDVFNVVIKFVQLLKIIFNRSLTDGTLNNFLNIFH